MSEGYTLTAAQHRKLGEIITKVEAMALPRPAQKKGRQGGGTVQEGIVKTYTKAVWDNSTNTMTAGSVEVYPYDSSNVIDRSGDTETFDHLFTFDSVAGASVSWIGSKVVVITCEAIDGWS